MNRRVLVTFAALLGALIVAGVISTIPALTPETEGRVYGTPFRVKATPTP